MSLLSFKAGSSGDHKSWSSEGKPAGKPNKQKQTAEGGDAAAKPTTKQDVTQPGEQELSGSIQRFQESLKASLSRSTAAQSFDYLWRTASGMQPAKKASGPAATPPTQQEQAAGKSDDASFDVLAALNRLTSLQD